MSEDTCGAILSIADDHGDNSATIRCQLEPGHDGPHSEKFERDDCGKVGITWEKDERVACPVCGKLVDSRMELLMCEYGVDWGNPNNDDTWPCKSQFCRECNTGKDPYFNFRCPEHEGT